MKALLDLFKQVTQEQEFDAIKTGLASPEKIRSWSYGEVKKPETINYRTFKPERDGLFCAKIFGPVKDYECLCGKYKRLKHRGVICEKCGVEVTLAKVRRERMGHIELASPVAHIWFLKSLPSRMGMVLDMTLRDIERVLYFEAYVVTDPGLTPLNRAQLLTEDDYLAKLEQHGDDFSATMGAEGIRELLKALDVPHEIEKLRKELEATGSETKIKKIAKRLKVLEAFQKSGIKPEWMILEVLPVLPPELRPLVPLDGGRFATSDLNDLYRRVINRNNRLKRLLELKAPDIIVRNEKRMLQEAVDSLLDNGRRGKAMTGANKRPLKSLADMIKGKGGRFRQNLLGKRVDYSGRSVIVVGPQLKLHQCGLPKLMALELFKPYIFNKLETMGLATTIKAAKKMVEAQEPVVWDILEDVIREHPVMLNRAPTLHRLGIQAFEPVLIEGKAIQLHPLVCTAFNADFDGDQMAVHVPLSLEAQMEARTLMLASNNVLLPSNGEPCIVPSQDIVLGLYYATREQDQRQGRGHAVRRPRRGPARLRVAPGRAAREDPRAAEADRNRRRRREGREDRPLRDDRRPRAAVRDPAGGLPFATINKPLKKKEISKIINASFRRCGLRETVIFADKLMQAGYALATRGGISFAADDMLIPEEKHAIIAEAGARGEGDRGAVHVGSRHAGRALQQGRRHLGPRRRRHREGDDAAAGLDGGDRPRRQEGQAGVLQLHLHDGGLRRAGLGGADPAARRNARPDGQARRLDHRDADHREFPRRPERAAVLHLDARRAQGPGRHRAEDGELGLPDAPPRRRDAGPGRDRGRLRHDQRRRDEGAGRGRRSHRGAARADPRPHGRRRRRQPRDAGDAVLPRHAAGRGRGRADRVARHRRGQGAHAAHLRHALRAVRQVLRPRPRPRPSRQRRRSGGRDRRAVDRRAGHAAHDAHVPHRRRRVADRRRVAAREQVGGHDPLLGADALRHQRASELVVIARSGEVTIHDDNGRERERHKVPYGATLQVKDGDQVKAGKVLAMWDATSRPIVTEYAGRVKFENVEEGVTVAKQVDEVTGLSTLVVIDPKRRAGAAAKGVRPQVKLLDESGDEIKLAGSELSVNITFQLGSIITVKDGQQVSVGEVLARIPQETSKTRDITGGLPRVAELFEARSPKDAGLLAEVTGTVSFGKDTKGKQRLVITDLDGVAHEYLIPKDKHVTAHDGQVVNKGESIVDGPADPHDILRLLGVEALARYITDEVQDVYRLQGVKINDKHIEVIVRQMLRRVQVMDAGDTRFIPGEQAERSDLLDENDKVMAEEGKQGATYEHMLLGITKASLSTDSFISAASFQETTRVLTEAAIMGKKDDLRGLKENVIVGRLIPAGTGLAYHNARKKQKLLGPEAGFLQPGEVEAPADATAATPEVSADAA